MKTHHVLKTHPAVFNAVRRGAKTFEVRKDDRAFQMGDDVTLIYHEPGQSDRDIPTSEDRAPMYFRVGFVLRGGQYGLEPGYVAFSLLPIDK